MEKRTMVLLGKTGSGKSATGNTILGRNEFQSRKSLDSVTQECEVKEVEINGKLIRVVDTPGFFETTMSKKKLAKELARSVYLSQADVHGSAEGVHGSAEGVHGPGEGVHGSGEGGHGSGEGGHGSGEGGHDPGEGVHGSGEGVRGSGEGVPDAQGGVHAFILVFPYERFTEQEEVILKKIQEVFGQKVTEHMILLFSHGEGVVDDEISGSSNEHLKACVEKCGGKYVIFNNTELNDRQQVTGLLDKIEEMVERNGGRRYTNEVYKAARRYIWEHFWEKFKELFLKLADTLLNIVRQGAQRAQEFSRDVTRLGKGMMSEYRQRRDEDNNH